MGGEGEGGRLRRRRERGPRGALKEGSGRGKSVSLSHLSALFMQCLPLLFLATHYCRAHTLYIFLVLSSRR